MKSVRWDLTPQKTFIIMQTGIIIENMFLFKIYNPDDRNLFFFFKFFFLQYWQLNPCWVHPNQANDYNSLRLLEVSWLGSSNKDCPDGRWFREFWEGAKAVEVADDGIKVDAPYERLISWPLQVFQQKLTHALVLKFQTQRNLGSKLDFMQWTKEATARIKLMCFAILSPVTVCFAILSPVTVCFAIFAVCFCYVWRCEHARFCVEVFYALYINFHSFIHSYIVACNSVLCSVVACDCVLCSVVACNSVLCSVVACDCVLCSVVACNSVLCSVVACDCVLCSVVACNSVLCSL